MAILQHPHSHSLSKSLQMDNALYFWDHYMKCCLTTTKRKKNTLMSAVLHSFLKSDKICSHVSSELGLENVSISAICRIDSRALMGKRGGRESGGWQEQATWWRDARAPANTRAVNVSFGWKSAFISDWQRKAIKGKPEQEVGAGGGGGGWTRA